MVYFAPNNSFFVFMSTNGAHAEIDHIWDDKNNEWKGELPEITEMCAIEKENPVDHEREMWLRKIQSVLTSLKSDEEKERQNILGRHPLF